MALPVFLILENGLLMIAAIHHVADRPRILHGQFPCHPATLLFMRKPRAERDPEILAHLSRPQAELAAGELLRGWLVKSQPDMLTDFLDALGIAHQGGVTDDIPESTDDEKLSAAIEKPLERHPSMKVAVYLQAFHTMNEGAWPKLGETLDNDSRLQLG